jgi:hypothetical protein
MTVRLYLEAVVFVRIVAIFGEMFLPLFRRLLYTV